MTISTDDFRPTLGHTDGRVDERYSCGAEPLSLRHRAVRVALLFRRHIDAIVRVTRVLQLRRPMVYRSVECPPPLDLALDNLAKLAELQEVVGSHTAEVVAIARASGATWDQVGTALGVSKQAAHERFRRPPQSLPGRATA